MKKLFTGLVAATLSSVSYADSVDIWRHNTSISSDDITFQYREEDEKDYKHFDLGYTFYKTESGTKYAINYRHISANKHTVEHRPYLTMDSSWGLPNDYKLHYKSYLEYRNYSENKDDGYRYAGKLSLSKSIGKVVYTLSNEYKIGDESGFESNELGFGAKVKLVPDLALSLFYLNVTDENWDKKAGIIGTQLDFTF